VPRECHHIVVAHDSGAAPSLHRTMAARFPITDPIVAALGIRADRVTGRASFRLLDFHASRH